jgi:hypothetical protein
MAVRRQDQCRPEPNLEDPQWHSGTPAPARSVGQLEATEQMGDPRQRDHDTQDGEQERRSNVRHEHNRAGHGPDRTGCERQLAAWALRRQPHWKVMIPLRIQYTPMKVTTAAGARS